MGLNKKEKLWVDNAFLKFQGDINKFIAWLEENLANKPETHKELIIYFDELVSQKESEEEQEKFKKRVLEYEELKKKIKEGETEIKKATIKKEYKDVIKWKKQLKKFLKEYNKIYLSLKEKYDKFSKESKETEEVLKLKPEIIECIMNSTDVIDVENPITRDKATYENLNKLDIDSLLSLMGVGIEELYEYIEQGKLRQ